MISFEQIDHSLTLYVNQAAGRSMTLDRFVFDVADTRLFSGGVFLVPYWWLWFKADGVGSHIHRRNIAIAVLSVGVLAVGVWLLKAILPFRSNPLNTASLSLHLPFGVLPASLNDINAFPSGHAALFFGLSVPLWMYSRWLGATMSMWALAMICLPLVYLGYHWPSDIAAGAMIGVAFMLLLCRLIGATRLPDRVVRLSLTSPPAFYAIGWLFAFETAVQFDDFKAFSLGAVRLAKELFAVSPA